MKNWKITRADLVAFAIVGCLAIMVVSCCGCTIAFGYEKHTHTHAHREYKGSDIIRGDVPLAEEVGAMLDETNALQEITDGISKASEGQ